VINGMNLLSPILVGRFGVYLVLEHYRLDGLSTFFRTYLDPALSACTKMSEIRHFFMLGKGTTTLDHLSHVITIHGNLSGILVNKKGP
jgi:hypothetical protein